MKKFYKYILLVLASCSFIAGCDKMENDFPYEDIYRRGLITPYCTISNSASSYSVSNTMGTKALINSTTPVDTILCNFLIIDENSEVNFDKVGYKTQWEEAYVSEASISTAVNSTVPNKYLRSISLQPERPYHADDKSLKTRMIGWYPRTCKLVRTADNYATTPFNAFLESSCVIDENGNACVKFTGLDGSKDIMVSDIREGSFDNQFGIGNSFTFKHYLSAVRVFAKSVNSTQDIGVWGEIEKVVFVNQPSSCTITLPQDPVVANVQTKDGSINDGFADNVIWGTETVKNKICTTPIFGEKDINNSNNLIAEEYPIKLSGGDVDKYLGYSLIKPDAPLWLQVHTKAGVYDVRIDNKAYKSNPESTAVDIFKAGVIYDIHLQFKTDGTIDAFLLNDGTGKFYDLTARRLYSDGETDSYVHYWSNCYIIDAYPIKNNTTATTSEAAENIVYDGFCFDATVVGNGSAGLLSIGAQSLYPTDEHISPRSADILWETSPGLITQVELLMGYVRFKVAKDRDEHGNIINNKYKEGNAVIAVYDKNGKILWSWHIWITDQPKALTYKEGNTEITILDRNLGATASKWNGINQADTSSGSLLETYGLYYQWGRKDPSMGPPNANYSPINMTTAPYYDYSSDRKDAAEVLRLPAPTLKDAVENPMYIILPTAQTQTYYFNWLNEKIDFLWGYEKDKGTNERKTIYDPCPYGYKVPGGELGDLLSSAQSESQYPVEGQIITNDNKTFYFPYTGYKGVDRGLNSLIASWKYVGQKADYQSAVVQVEPDKPNYMHRRRNYLSHSIQWTEVNVDKEYQGHQIQDHTNRRTAAPIRCVKNEKHNRISAFITPSKYSVSQASESVSFNLYAKSFGAKISSATLSVSYHMKTEGDNSGHKEYILQSWDNINANEWNYPNDNEELYFKFDEIKNVNSSGVWETENQSNKYIHINQTTGSILFTLRVKTKDYINRTATTTVRLAVNEVDFSVDSWDNITVLKDAPINKRIEIHGATRPTSVQMITVNSSGVPSQPVALNFEDISNSSTNSGYRYIYKSYTQDLSFTNAGWNGVMFKVTFEDGETITTDVKWFKVVTWNVSDNPISNMEGLISGKYYLIQNSSGGYLYDNGTELRGENDRRIKHLFQIFLVDDGYKIMNLSTGDYIKSDVSRLTVSPDAIDTDASIYSIDYKSNNNFIIKINSAYWRQNNNYYAVNLNLQESNKTYWKFYKVSLSTVEGDHPSLQQGNGS